MDWQLMVDAPQPGLANMARDIALAEAVAAGASGPVLRLYGWSPPAVSLGRNQDEALACDAAACAAAGWDVVRRPTGGRAVLHGTDEVTYSVALPLEAAPAGVLAAYAWLAQGLLAAYRLLGLPAELAAGHRLPARSGACFDAPAASEITIAGRKVAGSAQVRRAGYLLQHGSLPVRFDPALHAKLLGLRPAAARLLGRHGAGLADFLDPPPARSVIEQALRQGFEQALSLTFANCAGRPVRAQDGGERS